MNLSKEYIRSLNQWKNVADKLDTTNLYTDKKEYIYPGDEDIIHTFNEKVQQDFKLILGIPPEPFQGNPLKAKVIILSLNPGYIEQVNCKLAQMLRTNIIKEIVAEKKRTLNLDADSFFTHDAINVLGDWYWYNRFKGLKEEIGQSDINFFKKVALIQFIAYSSFSFDDLPRNSFLPSQDFTKLLIRYIATECQDTVFLILRGKNKWKKLIDADVWINLEESGRLICKPTHIRTQAISRATLGDNEYNKLLNILKM